MITFEQLEAFRTIVKAGTFSRAADELYVTQPALSQRIKHLEQALGVELFDRSRRGQHVQLTLAGQATLEFADHVASELQRLQRQVRGMFEAPEREALDLAAGPNATHHLLPSILEKFNAVCPNIRINIVESIAFGDMLPHLVRTGICELAITGLVENDPRLKLVPLVTYHFVLIARHDHPVLHEASPLAEALFRYPFAVMPVQSEIRRELEHDAIAAGTRLDVAVESYDFGVLKDAALRGLALAVVPQVVLNDAISASRLVSIEALDFPRDVQIYLLYDSGRELSHAAQSFLAIAPAVGGLP